MADNFDYREDSFVNSIIGEGTRLAGEFDLNGLLRIDGEFFGKVRTKGKVLIGKSGVAVCKIFAGTVVIGGRVKGDIFATERIILLSTGVLIGNIITPRIVIEEGVLFDGTCEIIEDKDRFEKLKGNFLSKYFTSGSFGELDKNYNIESFKSSGSINEDLKIAPKGDGEENGLSFNYNKKNIISKTEQKVNTPPF